LSIMPCHLFLNTKLAEKGDSPSSIIPSGQGASVDAGVGGPSLAPGGGSVPVRAARRVCSICCSNKRLSIGKSVGYGVVIACESVGLPTITLALCIAWLK